MDTERLWALIVEGHLLQRHQSEDGTKIEHAAGVSCLRPAACVERNLG